MNVSTKFAAKIGLEETHLVQLEPGKWIAWDGRPATKKEIKQHFEIRKRNDRKLEDVKKNIRETKVSDQTEFEHRYRKSIEEFWEEGYKDYSNWDRDDLILNLSITIFDSYYGSGSRGAEDECLDQIKNLFPDEYYEALEGFVRGNHDT